MPGYLEGYGAGEAARERKLFLWIGSTVAVALLVTILYFSFRDYKHEQTIKGFLNALRAQDYKTAYSFWGCTEAAPCRDYSFAKFTEDWGPQGANAKYISSGLSDTERCGTGYIGALGSEKDQLFLWVERQNGVLGYSPWNGCPERKLRIMRWLKMKFGQS
ncbi:MAG: hypothetical protein JNK87_31440 [Bryobacterales bacterium]|nr:hypothetical protein [Bryobacterales bacterium]